MRLSLDVCEVDTAARQARRRDGTLAALTDIEARLIEYLADRSDRPVPRDELLSEVWGLRGAQLTRCVDTAIRRIRSKVEREPGEPSHILTVHGVGYRLDRVGRPVPAIPVASAEPLYGREAELAAIGRRSGIVTVGGPPGSGRDRAIREAARYPHVEAVRTGIGGDVVLGPIGAEDAARLWAERGGAPNAELAAFDGLPGLIAEAAGRVDGRAPRFEEALRTAVEALPAAAAAALDAVSCFEGEFTLDDAVFVGLRDIDGLQTLVDSGWVVGRPRMRLLRPLRRGGDRDRHLAWVLARAEALHADLRTKDARAATDGQNRLWDDFLAAHARACAVDPIAAVRLLVAFDMVLCTERDPDLRCRLLDRVPTPADALSRTRWLQMRGEAHRRLFRFEVARQHLRAAVAAAEASADPLEIGMAHGYLATLDHTVGDVIAAEHGYRFAADVVGDPHYRAVYLGEVGRLHLDHGRMDEAEELFREVLAIRLRQGGPRHLARARTDLGRVLAARGRHGEARRCFEKELADPLVGPFARGHAGHQLGLLLIDADQAAEAVPVLQAALVDADAAKDQRGRAHILHCLALCALDRPRDAIRQLWDVVELHRVAEATYAGVPLAWIAALHAPTREARALADEAAALPLSRPDREVVDALRAAVFPSESNARIIAAQAASESNAEVRVALRWLGRPRRQGSSR